MTKERNRIIYFDILRIMATFFVIVLHVSATNWRGTDIYSFEWRMMTLFNSISRWCVPVFVMISGALFLHRKIPIRQIYGKYILRLVLSFAFWSFVYAAVWYAKGDKDIAHSIRSFIKGYNHLWFIYMIIGLYMITPMHIRIVSDEKLLRYFLILSFVFAVAIPQIISIIRAFSVQDGDWAESVIDQAHLQFVLGFSFYYVLGYYVSNTNLTGKQSGIIYIGGLSGFLSTVVLTFAMSRYKGEATDLFYSYMSVNVVLEALSVFVFIRNLFSHAEFREKPCGFIRQLSKYSFGIYLVHALIITTLDMELGLSNLSFNTMIAIPVISILVFALSYLVSAVFNHIPVVKIYLV